MFPRTSSFSRPLAGRPGFQSQRRDRHAHRRRQLRSEHEHHRQRQQPGRHRGDTDTLTLRGTNGTTPLTSGNETVTADFNLAGGPGTEWVSVNDTNGGAVLYKIQSLTNIRTVDLELLGGKDRVTLQQRTKAGGVKFVNLSGGSGDDTFTVVPCSDSDTASRSALTRPTAIEPPPVIVTATASMVVAQPVSNPFCPLVAPFNIVVGVVVRPNGEHDDVCHQRACAIHRLSGIQTPQVTLPMPQVTLPAPVPTTGTMVQNVSGIAIPLSGTTIPLTIPIGCGGSGRQGTLVVIVETSDDSGRTNSQQLSVSVR